MSRRRKRNSANAADSFTEPASPGVPAAPAPGRSHVRASQSSALGYASPRPGVSASGRFPNSASLLTQAAFILSLALVIARLLMPESIRSPEDPLAAGRPAGQIIAGNNDLLLSQSAQSPGPAAGIVLDLFFCLPAILILIRRAIDANYRLLQSAAMTPMALLALLVLCSPLWAADRFASVVSAMHFFCAMVFLWSTFQLIRSWIRLRIVAGVCIGAVLALSLVGYTYRLSELRDLRQMFNEKKAQILAQHEWMPGSYQAEMFEKRILNGQPMGFRSSTNTYAALLVLLGVVSAGVVIQHVSDKDHWGWSIVPIVAAAATLPVIHWTLCRAAYVTPLIAAMILGATWIMRRWFASVRSSTATSPKTPVLRYSEEPGHSSEEPGSSEYLSTGVVGKPAGVTSTDTVVQTSPVAPLEATASAKADPTKPGESHWRTKQIRFWHAAYFSVLVGVAGLVAFIVHHGMRFGTLWHDSLSFRWRYWVGSWRILTSGAHRSPRDWSHFLLGVGWENFGPAYLKHRLAIAPEEIRDPHNFIIRAFVELGMVGGILMLAWMLRLWWELTRPVLPIAPITNRDGKDSTFAKSKSSSLKTPVLRYSEEPDPSRGKSASSQDFRNGGLGKHEFSETRYGTRTVIQTIVGIALLAMVINTLAAIDFGAQGAYIIVELSRRCLFFLLLAGGLLTACIRRSAHSSHDKPGDIQLELDDRPAPWILCAILAALGTFLIHNLIEFALFEPGPLFLFALLTGGALGIRAQGRAQEEPPIPAEPSSARWKLPAIGAGLAGMAWLLAGGALAVPIIQAESLAHDADDDTLASLKSHDQRLMIKAASEMAGAFQAVPYNADYARRTAELLLASGSDRADFSKTKKMLDAAIAADPLSVPDLIMRGELALQSGGDHPDAAQIEAGIRDYDQALKLDPNNVRMRIEFGHQLLRAAKLLHKPKLAADAALEFDRALDYNAQLPPDEIKRLTPQELSRLQTEKAESESFRSTRGTGVWPVGHGTP